MTKTKSSLNSATLIIDINISISVSVLVHYICVECVLLAAVSSSRLLPVRCTVTYATCAVLYWAVLLTAGFITHLNSFPIRIQST